MKRFLFISGMIVISCLSFIFHTAAAGFQPSQVKPTPRPELQLRWLASVTLSQTTAIGSSVGGNITGTIHLLRPAFNSLTVNLALEGALLDEAGILVATAPASVTIPAGNDRATFVIQTLSSPNTTAATSCIIRARFGDERVSAQFTVEPLRLTSLTIVPGAGIGPLTTMGTVVLNARPNQNKTVTLTSSNPIVRFGTIGNSQATATLIFTSASSLRTFPLVTGPVSQTTTVTITAQLGAQTLTRQITVRPPL